MRNHLPPDKLAARLGIATPELLERARRLGVPIVHGRIDRSLFELADRAARKGRRAA